MMDNARLEKIWTPWLEKEDYQADLDMRRLNRLRFYELIGRHFKDNARVLEIGCGTGIDSNILAGEAKRAKFYATDISPKSISLAKRITKQLGNKVFIVRGDINKLYFKDRVFDVVFSQGVIEHFRNPVAIINEQMRVLKDGGVLIISVPQRYTAYTLMKKIKLYRKSWEWEWETEYSYGGLKNLSLECGLREVEAMGYQYWRSWWELAWVLRDFYDKFFRRIPWGGNKFPFIGDKSPFINVKQGYDKLWDFLEQRWGMYFMQNLAIAFVKEKTTT